jgi:diaminopropionate ammonia-lyase
MRFPFRIRVPHYALTRAFLNPGRDDSFRGLFTADEYRDVHGYYAAHPELAPTPLRSLRSIADTLGLATVYAKDETHRFGVNAFKIAGVQYAVHRLGDDAAARGLVCATAGNHGRAVTHVGRHKHLPCTVFVPVLRTADPVEIRTRSARVAAMRQDGATVVDVDGTYEDAVAEAARYGERTGATVISDTSWEGYDEIPRWIMAGYTQLFQEALSQWDAPPTIVVVQGGVGGLVCAAASWFAHEFAERPYFVVAEPENAACLLASAEAGRPITIGGSLETIMAGLRCAAPSPAAWPAIASGVDAFVTVPDEAVLGTMKVLNDAPSPEQIHSGPSGACGLAALVAVARDPNMAELRAAARLDRSTRALVVITEGA